MLKKQSLLLLFLFCISQAGYSNPKLFPGYYIDLKGDTVRCNIEFNDWNLNPKTIRLQAGNELKEFGPEDIMGFGVTGYSNYVSARVSYHTNPISGPDLPAIYSDSVVTKASFLQVLETGPYSLYVLIFPQRIYLFNSSPDRPISELVYRVKMDNDSLQEDQSYKQQLVNLLMNEGLSEKYFGQVSKFSYNSSQIASLFRILNGTHTRVWTKKKSDGDFQIELFVGAIRNSFPTSFDGVYSKSNQFDPSYSPSGGINFLYSIPGHFKAFKVGISVGYDGYNNMIKRSGSFYHAESVNFYYTTTYNETITAKRSMLLSNIYVMWLLNPLSKVKVFVKAGLNYNFSMGTNSDVVSTYTASIQGIKNGNVPFQDSTNTSSTLYSLKTGYLAPVFSGGIISGRSKLEFAYWPPVSVSYPLDVTSGNTSSSTFFKFGSLGIFYYFSLFKPK